MKKIGRYIVRGLLGRGGMGRVYKVEMPVTGKIAALKLLDPDTLLVTLMGMENIRKLFVGEAAAMAALRHPRLLDIWDYDEDGGMPFYLMNYYCNNLGDMIGESYMVEKPSRRIGTEKAVRYVRQILEGLACLHYAGIIHRDIKPFNILVTDEDTVKICDFGLSKMRGEAFRGPANLKVGSPWYASPEQTEDPDAVDFSADLYAVGVMLYRMLTGRLPADAAQPPSAFNPDLGPGWDRFILKAVDGVPERRFQDAGAMLTALAEVHADWLQKQAMVCSAPFTADGETTALACSPARKSQKPRSRPLKVLPKGAPQVFGLDELFRPRIYTDNSFDISGDGIVADRATGLLWERSGSLYPMTWQRACGYIESLNDQRFSDRTDWRLPTVAELMTLLTPTPHGRDLCIPPIFNATQRRLWSCDACSHVSAWYAGLDLGFIARQDHTAYYHVRAVCGLEPFSCKTAGGRRG